MLVLIFVILIFGLAVFGDRLIRVSAKEVALERGLSPEYVDQKFSIAPQLVLKSKSDPRKPINLKKGFNIYIKGQAPLEVDERVKPGTYALKPADLAGMSPIPKLHIEQGAEVKAGDPVFFDKRRPNISFTAPVSGEFVELRRGDKRAITELVFLADKEIKYKDFGKHDPKAMDADAIKQLLLESGAWTLIRQRPYDIIPDPDEQPKLVYISCFSTAPMAPDYDFACDTERAAFQAGINALAKLTDGGVHLGMDSTRKHARVFTDALSVTHHWFSGPHPAGNAGVQIHHISPVKKGESVWVLKPQDVVILGRLFTEGRYNTQRLVSVNGPDVKEPIYVRVHQGACIEPMMVDNLEQDHVRFISGDVLTGSKVERNGFLGYYDDMVSVIEEGDFLEPFGWILPSYPRPSVSPTFLSHFFSGEELRVNTNTHGEKRPFVVTGLYEELLPMDIYPMILLKAIITEDFEGMEGLGIYEVVEEDLAICEFACPSKTAMQSILRKGLDMVREEG